MKFIYPAVFHKTEEGHYKGYFPDLECCYGEGETLDEAIESANEAARDWITLELSEDEPMIPYVSDIEYIEVKDGEIIRNISMNNLCIKFLNLKFLPDYENSSSVLIIFLHILWM